MNLTAPPETCDILLINPPSTDDQEHGLLSGAGAHRPPLNLLNLGAVLLERGYTVQIQDLAKTVLRPEEYLAAILSRKPRFIGITAMTAFIAAAASLAAGIKEKNPGITVIVGGIHITTKPKETMDRHPSFDIGVIGEGDITIQELLPALEMGTDLRQIKGIIYRNGKELVMTEPREHVGNLDTLPFPAWRLIPDLLDRYKPTASRQTRLPSAYLVTSRGCPHACSFCANLVHGRSFRSHSVTYIIAMIDHLIRQYGVKDITIYDENLLLSKKRAFDLCRDLIDRRYDLTWSCDARADSFDEDLIPLMYQAGCRSVWVGMESGNDRILAGYGKGTTLDDYRRAAALANRHGILITGSFIIGGPGETPATIRDTIRFAKSLGLDYFVPFFYTPVPGTRDYENILTYGTADLRYESLTMTKPTFAPHGMTCREVYHWYLWSLVSFYIHPRTLWRYLRRNGAGATARTGVLFLLKALFSNHPSKGRSEVMERTGKVSGAK